MGKQLINNSANIAVFESKIISDLCVGKFFIDATPTVFKTITAANNVLGVKIKITNPYGFDVKEYSNTYDILPPINSTYSFLIPKQDGNFQFGTYIISLEITDADGTKHEVTEPTRICQINTNDARQKKGVIFAKMIAKYRAGKIVVLVDQPPTYQGVLSQSKVQNYTLIFPTGTIATPLITTQPSFEDILFPGRYKLIGEVCAIYNYGNNNYAKVPYTVNTDKNVSPLVNECAVSAKLIQITKDLREDSCKDREYLTEQLFAIIADLETIRLGNECDVDISETIIHLHELIGLECIIGNVGTPITAIGTPAESIVITGCNVTETQTGLTKTYNIGENYSFEVTVNPANNSFVVIGQGVLNGCTKTQTLTFDIAALYTEIKNQVVAQNDFVQWANFVKKGFVPTAANLTCLGITLVQYKLLDYDGFWNLVLSKFCGCCAGGTGSCTALISNLTATANGQTTKLEWKNNLDVFEVDIYVDGFLHETVLISGILYDLTGMARYSLVGFNNKQTHTVNIIAKCTNGTKGNNLTVVFSNEGCPNILPPSLNTNSVPNASCPFNLATVIQGAVPLGLTLEWHNANTTTAATLLPNPVSVTSGTYYAFYKDVNGCASAASQVQIVCQQVGNCSEALNVLIVSGAGNTSIITFSSAISSPPSYLVKRRLASAANVPANYITIGTPIYNAGATKYEIVDTNTTPNILYVYLIESQCSDDSRPEAIYTFSKITCVVLSLSPTATTLPFSFVPLGGDITKYVVELYDNAEVNLLDTKVFLPAFTSPTSDIFTGLSTSVNYKIRVTSFINKYKQVCPFEFTLIIP